MHCTGQEIIFFVFYFLHYFFPYSLTAFQDFFAAVLCSGFSGFSLVFIFLYISRSCLKFGLDGCQFGGDGFVLVVWHVFECFPMATPFQFGKIGQG